MSMRRDTLDAMRHWLMALVMAGCGSDPQVMFTPDAGRAVSPMTRDECEARVQELGNYGAMCATVYAFDAPAANPLGHVEGCVPDVYLDEAQAKYGPAHPSTDPRFAGVAMPPCIWTCPEVVDCNAYDSCLCPSPPAL